MAVLPRPEPMLSRALRSAGYVARELCSLGLFMAAGLLILTTLFFTVGG